MFRSVGGFKASSEWNRTLNGLSEEQPNAHCNFFSIRRQGQVGKKKRKALIVGQW